MSQQLINLGSVANDGTGNPLRTGGQDINANFTELYQGLYPVLNVMNYGAVGDGVTDDTAAWVAAVAAIPAGGGFVMAPLKSFLLSATVTLPADRFVGIMGCGGHAQSSSVVAGTRLLRAGGFTSGPLMRQTGGASPVYGAQIARLAFDGNGVAGDLLELNQTNMAHISRVVFANSLGNGLYAPGLWNAALDHCRWLGVGNGAGTTAGLWLDATATNATNTVTITQPQFEAMTGRSVWIGNTGGANVASLVQWIGGKIEQSSNALGLPFIDLHAAADITILGLACANGLDNGSTHIQITSGNRITLDTAHAVSTTTDAQNPTYFVDVQAGSDVQVHGRYYRGGGNSGAQVHIASGVTGWRLGRDNVYDSSLSKQVLLGSGTTLARAASGASGYTSTMAAFGAGATVIGPLQGADIVYVANGNTGIILATAQDGHVITIVNEGATAITWNATDDTSHVLNATGNTITGGTAARFAWDSRKGAAGLWVRC